MDRHEQKPGGDDPKVEPSQEQERVPWEWSTDFTRGGELRYPPPRVVVMIPCLNEAGAIASVIQSIPRELPGVNDVRVLAIDDGSHDETSLVAARAGADAVIRHKTNLGLGQTFKDGLEACLRMGADIIVNLDADGQYDSSEIPLLLDPILRGEADIVLGNRQIEGLSHVSWSRTWGNRIASWVTRRLSHLPIIDAQTGFRSLTREAAIRLTLNGGYTYTQEMILQAASRGLVIEEVPITFKRRLDGGSRLVTSIWRYALRAGGTIARSYRDHNPLKVFTFIGSVVLVIGGLVGLRVISHYLETGTVSPYLPSAILAAILGIVGFQIIIFGLLADMLKTHRRLTEEILLSMRENGTLRGRERP